MNITLKNDERTLKLYTKEYSFSFKQVGLRGLQGVKGDPGVGVPVGGTTGQVLAKSSNSNYATSWITPVDGGGGGAVDSVNTQTGVVVLTKSDIGLSNVDNTSDASKPVSIATATALAGKANTSHSHAEPEITGLVGDLATKASASDLSTHTSDTNNPHVVTKAQVGLGNVDNTSDSSKPISSAAQTALNAKADLVGGLVPTAQIPAQALTTVQTAANQSAMLALTTQAGDIVVRSDQHKSYMHNGGTAGTMADFTLLDTPSDAVTSVNSQTGTVVLSKGDIGLSNVDNTSDSAKPVSTAQQTALDGKANTSHTHAQSDITNLTTDLAAKASVTALTTHTSDTANPHIVTKSQVGLSNVDNTSDANKPVSTAQATSIATKEPVITAGTSAQYYRGDKSWQTLNQDAVPDGTTNRAFTATEKTKLAGIATAATANDTDANLKNRANHTGTQTASTISDFNTAADARITAATGVSVQGYSANTTTLGNTTTGTGSIVRGNSPALVTPTGIVKGDVGLGNVDNTSDVSKPVSTAQQTALNLKANLASPTFTGTIVLPSGQVLTSPSITTPTGIVKGDVGLGNVDNTSNATERAAVRTLTNARITRRVVSTTSAANPAINTDVTDLFTITAQAVTLTSFTTNLTGTPTDGQILHIAITDNGTTRTIGWGASFETSTVALPAATVASTRIDVLLVWNAVTSKWRCLAVA